MIMQEIVTNQLVIPFVMMETIMLLVNLMVETVVTNKEQQEFLGTIGVRLVMYNEIHKFQMSNFKFQISNSQFQKTHTQKFFFGLTLKDLFWLTQFVRFGCLEFGEIMP